MPENFYHVDSHDRLQEGQVLSLKEIPEQITSHSIRGNTIPRDLIHTTLTEYYEEGLSQHGLRYTGSHPQVGPNQINSSSGSFYYEQFLENTRINKFPNKLSRFQAFFACETIEDSKKFADNYRNNHEEVKIWKVSGQPQHKGDYSLLAIPPQYGAALGMATMYWEGETPNENPFWEILLQLPVEVVSLEETYSPSEQ